MKPAMLFVVLVYSAMAGVSITTPTFSVSVNESGSYRLEARDLPWIFAGEIGNVASNLSTLGGIDTLGAYEEITFDYNLSGRRHASIRAYSARPVILFSIQYLDTSSNSSPFPVFHVYPTNLAHLTYNGMFAEHSFMALGRDSPWVFFDSAANTFILSPAGNFLVASTIQTDDGNISSGVDQRIDTLPAGFRQSTMLVVDKGINQTFGEWGQALTNLQGKSRPANDSETVLNLVGYWTDAGAAYYYHFEPDLGYEKTLLGVRDEFRKQGLQLGYMQLDSWFYPKGPAADWRAFSGGIYQYVGDPALFPNTLPSFQQQLGVPLVTHARWIDASSPYRRTYLMSGNVSIDPRYWDDVAGYLADAGVVTYEQDWLDDAAHSDFNLADPDAFFDQMATSLARRGLTMQYCMQRPGQILQSSKYSNLTTMRASADRFGRSRWDKFLYTSRFASALGVWPWADVFMSGETENLLLATLSAGPVGVGDEIASLRGDSLLRAVRADGVIVKPDTPLVPLDATILSDAWDGGGPMIAAAATDFGSLKAAYVVTYNRGDFVPAAFTAQALGFNGPVYVFDFFQKAGTILASQDVFTAPPADFAYYIVVPVGASGIAFLGDADQFVSLGRKRVTQLSDDGALHVSISFAAQEKTRTIHGYAPEPPSFHAIQGTIGQSTYDSVSQVFYVQVSPDSGGRAVIEIRVSK